MDAHDKQQRRDLHKARVEDVEVEVARQVLSVEVHTIVHSTGHKPDK